MSDREGRFRRIRIWHLLVAVLVCAVLAALARSPFGIFLIIWTAFAGADFVALWFCLRAMDRAEKRSPVSPGIRYLAWNLLLIYVILGAFCLLLVGIFALILFVTL